MNEHKIVMITENLFLCIHIKLNADKYNDDNISDFLSFFCHVIQQWLLLPTFLSYQWNKTKKTFNCYCCAEYETKLNEKENGYGCKVKIKFKFQPYF